MNCFREIELIPIRVFFFLILNQKKEKKDIIKSWEICKFCGVLNLEKYG
jgi:hypothetical protein